MSARPQRQHKPDAPRDATRRSPERAQYAHETADTTTVSGPMHSASPVDYPTPQWIRRQWIVDIQRRLGNAAAQRYVHQLQRHAVSRPNGHGEHNVVSSSDRVAEASHDRVAEASHDRVAEASHDRVADQSPAVAVTSLAPRVQRKGAVTTERVTGTLWATDAEGKPLPPSLEDISQGGLNDCFLFAAMAAIVNTNPNKIRSMIRDHGNGTYTVTFKGIGVFSSAEQTVSADFPVNQHGNVGARKATWPLIIEKAYTQQKGGVDELNKGGNPGDAVDDILNTGPSRFDPRDKTADYIMGKLTKAKQEKWPMTILAPKKDGAGKEKKEMANKTPGLYFWHAYTILDVDPAKNRVKLFNPWGNNHPNGDGWIEIELVRTFFIEISIND